MEDKRLVQRPRPQINNPDYGYHAGHAFRLRDIIAIIIQRDDDASLWKNRSGEWDIFQPLRKYRIKWSFKWQNKPLPKPSIRACQQLPARAKNKNHIHFPLQFM
jgi:hypothetical protein